MFNKRFYFSFIISILGAFCAMIFAEKGLGDLSRMISQIRGTEAHIHQLEKSNENLQRQLKLLQSADSELLEARIRSEYGLVHPGEWVYLESSKPSF